MLKKILVLIIILTLSNCRWFTGAGTTFLGGTRFKIPDGTPKFQKGFKDGCGTVLYARGNIFYRTFYNHDYDTKLIRDSEYNFGYKRGYAYCFQYIVPGVGSSDNFIVPKEYTPFDMGAGNLNSTWNYGNLDWGVGSGGNAPQGLNGVFGAMNQDALGSHFLWGTPNTGQIFGAGSQGQYGLY